MTAGPAIGPSEVPLLPHARPRALVPGILLLLVIASGCLDSPGAITRGQSLYGKGTPIPAGPPEPLPECPYYDCSRQYWNVTLTPAVDGGHYLVGLPLLVGETQREGTLFEMWVANLTGEGNATFTVEDMERGKVLVIEGWGTVTVRSQSLQGPRPPFDATAYTYAEWTTRPERPWGMDGLSLPVFVDGPLQEIKLEYHGRSSYCGRHAEYNVATPLQNGWNDLVGDELPTCH